MSESPKEIPGWLKESNAFFHRTHPPITRAEAERTRLKRLAAELAERAAMWGMP